MIEGACAWSPDSLSFVIQRTEKEKKMKEKKKRKNQKPESIQEDSFQEREKIINAFIDSIKMKDYCIATRSFASFSFRSSMSQ